MHVPELSYYASSTGIANTSGDLTIAVARTFPFRFSRSRTTRARVIVTKLSLRSDRNPYDLPTGSRAAIKRRGVKNNKSAPWQIEVGSVERTRSKHRLHTAARGPCRTHFDRVAHGR